MDPNSARAVLRIDPHAALTTELVDAAFAAESAARHPSLYPDAAGRDAAVRWAATLHEARETLVSTMPERPGGPLPTTGTAWEPPESALAAVAPGVGARPTPSRFPAATPAEHTLAAAPVSPVGRRWSRGAIAGMAVGAAVLAAGVIAGAVAIGMFVVQTSATVADAVAESAVERYYSGETMYTFPAALEIYSDGRHLDLCDPDWLDGCWDMAVFTEQPCEDLEVTIGFSNRSMGSPAATEIRNIENVPGNEATVVVFGDDEFDYGWIQDVVCVSDQPD